jgi:hypothetical protein
MIESTDPKTFWLNVTNALLGLVTIAAFVAVVGVAVYDFVWKKIGHRAPARELEPRGLRVPTGPHAHRVPALGLTMADGGEVRPETGAAPPEAGDAARPVKGTREDDFAPTDTGR